MFRVARAPLSCIVIFFIVAGIFSVIDFISTKSTTSINYVFGLLILTIILNFFIYVIKMIYHSLKGDKNKTKTFESTTYKEVEHINDNDDGIVKNDKVTKHLDNSENKKNRNSFEVNLTVIVILFLIVFGVLGCSFINSFFNQNLQTVTTTPPLTTFQPTTNSDNSIVLTPTIVDQSLMVTKDKVVIDPTSLTCDISVPLYYNETTNTVDGLITNNNSEEIASVLIKIDVYELNSSIFVYSFNIRDSNLPPNTQKRIRSSYYIPTGTAQMKDGEYSCKASILSIN